MHVSSVASEGDLTLPLSGAQLLLLRQVLVEAGLGIRLDNFSTQVGVSKATAKGFIRKLGELLDNQPHDSDLLPLGTFDVDFSTRDAKAFRNALELVMSELGHEEFSRRTGFQLAEAAQLLDALNAALIAPLHIEHRRQAIGHDPQVINKR